MNEKSIFEMNEDTDLVLPNKIQLRKMEAPSKEEVQEAERWWSFLPNITKVIIHDDYLGASQDDDLSISPSEKKE